MGPPLSPEVVAVPPPASPAVERLRPGEAGEEDRAEAAVSAWWVAVREGQEAAAAAGWEGG